MIIEMQGLIVELAAATSEIPEKITIKEGDTLCNIAKKYTSNPDKWRDIVDVNPQKPQNQEWWNNLQINEQIFLPKEKWEKER